MALRAWIVCAFVLPLAGCIFLISGKAGGDACGFAGAESACGTCVREQCQELVDTCCRDQTCGPSLSKLDRCAESLDDGCASLARSTESATAFGRLATCVGNRCSIECPGAQPKGRTRCSSPLLGDGKTCECEPSSQPNAFECTGAAFPGTICCAPDGWPAAGQRCSCRTIDCFPGTSGACFCRLADSNEKLSVCEGTTCCAAEGTCVCGTAECVTAGQKVPRCELETMRCPAGQRPVAACSLLE